MPELLKILTGAFGVMKLIIPRDENSFGIGGVFYKSHGIIKSQKETPG